MFDVAKDAGVLPSDIAKHLGVHRVTVSSWFNGHNEPHRYLKDKVEKLLDAIDAAVEIGELPAPRDIRPRERSGYVDRIIARHLGVDEAADSNTD
jgi:transcriptional regulator with XRE-family HTH domain